MRGALIATTLVGWAVLDSLAQHKAAAGRPPVRTEADRGSAAFAQVTGFGGLALGLVLARRMPLLDLPGTPALWLAIGLPIAWAGIALRVVAVRTLGAMFNPLVSIHEGHRVVESGPYRLVRHPSYTGVLVMSLGIGLATANLGSTVIIAGVRLAGYIRRIGVEENALEEGLGELYVRYARGRSRLVPGVW
jgi:protein-S-isoprenylcysteine O-methyltransferase Ste14